MHHGIIGYGCTIYSSYKCQRMHKMNLPFTNEALEVEISLRLQWTPSNTYCLIQLFAHIVIVI